MARKRLEAGAYQLAKDIANPIGNPRVRRDWMKQMRFSAGEKFLVRKQSGRVTIKPVRARGLHLQEGDFPYNREPYRELFRLITHALEPVEEDVEAMFARLTIGIYDTEDFLRWLVERGEVPRDQFETLFAKWRDQAG